MLKKKYRGDTLINATREQKIISYVPPHLRLFLYFTSLSIYVYIKCGYTLSGAKEKRLRVQCSPLETSGPKRSRVHLSKMTSAVPTCSPKDLCSKRESLSKSPFVRSAVFRRAREFGIYQRVQSTLSCSEGERERGGRREE